MRAENRLKREGQILAAAYRVLETAGPAGLSMQAVAREAKASMETLYRWYGDKTGLYAALVAANAVEVEEALSAAEEAKETAEAALVALGARLFDMVTGDRAVALNRAAAADATGTLGAALTAEGRGRVMPLIAAAVARLGLPPDAAAPLFIDLLLGDIQIRRVTAVAPLPDPGTGHQRAERATTLLVRLAQGGL